jgi:mRNA interferase RelE/StbE
MSFSVDYSNQAKKFLKKSNEVLVKRLLNKIEELQKKPILHDTKTIEGSEKLFRVRVGDYRILYEVDHDNNLIGIVKIDKRSKVY